VPNGQSRLQFLPRSEIWTTSVVVGCTTAVPGTPRVDDDAAQVPRAPQWVVDGVYRTLAAVDGVFRELAVPYTLLAGSLLGAVRHHGMIPWDDDGDLAIRHEDVVTVREKAGPALEQRGVGLFHEWEVGLKAYALDGRITEHDFLYPSVDIFPVSLLEGRWQFASTFQRQAWPESELAPDTFTRLTGHHFGPLSLPGPPLPAARRYLDACYGPAWSTTGAFSGFHEPLGEGLESTSTDRFEAVLPSADALKRPIVAQRHARTCPTQVPGLDVSEDDDHLVVRRRPGHGVIELNNTAALVFVMATGSTSIEEMARVLEGLFLLKRLPLKEVADSVDELTRIGLLA
jgi:lipopolysaccharide cholinephosphotransferase